MRRRCSSALPRRTADVGSRLDDVSSGPAVLLIQRMVGCLTKSVSVLEVDPDLMGRLDPSQVRVARLRAMARAVVLRPGEWNPWEWVEHADRHLGLLVIDGLLTREVSLLGRRSMELVGSEDLLRPWDDADRHLSVPQTVTWKVQRRAVVAVLDHRFAERIAPWPAITAGIVSRALSRAQWLAIHLATLENPRVELRLLLLMWYLADRWGRVEPDGVTVPLPLTHNVLGRLVRAQRPTVTSRLNDLEARRLLTRRADGGWLLHGEPAQQLRRLDAAGDGEVVTSATCGVAAERAGWLIRGQATRDGSTPGGGAR